MSRGSDHGSLEVRLVMQALAGVYLLAQQFIDSPCPTTEAQTARALVILVSVLRERVGRLERTVRSDTNPELLPCVRDLTTSTLDASDVLLAIWAERRCAGAPPVADPGETETMFRRARREGAT
jgi:hypothetical protein